MVDAGSSGWRNFPDFKGRVIDRAKTRVLVMLNIVGQGMGGGAIEQNVEDMRDVRDFGQTQWHAVRDRYHARRKILQAENDSRL